MTDTDISKLHAFSSLGKSATLCQHCGKGRAHSNHKGYDWDEVEPPQIAETAKYHAFKGSGKGCAECGSMFDNTYHLHAGRVEGTKPETIAEEAQRIVYGDREQAYDDPNQNFRRVAQMWTGTLDKKLAPGQVVTPRDVALMFIQLKISREAFMPKRDNRVDIIGYALCLERIVAEEDKNNASE